jgi:hypothetical protein
MEINRAHRELPTVGRRASTLGEIVNPAVISTYFTCLRQAGEAKRSLFQLYFNRISTLYFLPNCAVTSKQSHTHHKLMRRIG